MVGFNDHSYRMFLDRKLYLATVKLQADHGLGKSYSALLPFVEGLHAMGYLDSETFELYRNKYSVGLEETANIKSPAQIIKEETKAAKYRQLNNHFGEVLAQWSMLKDKSKQYHLKEAEKHKTLKNAKLLLELGKQEAECVALEG